MADRPLANYSSMPERSFELVLYQTAAELDALLPAILDKAFKGEM
jgi:hypothetical protein